MRGAREAADEGQGPAAVGTAARGLVRRGIIGRAVVDVQAEGGGQRLWQTLVCGLCGELFLEGCERGAGVGVQEAGVPDFLEPFGQDVL